MYNTYCLQPYTALFVFVFMAATLHSSFFKGFYSPCPKREIRPFLKGSNISETVDTTPTKTGVHAFDIDPYLHELFEPILIN